MIDMKKWQLNYLLFKTHLKISLNWQILTEMQFWHYNNIAVV